MKWITNPQSLTFKLHPPDRDGQESERAVMLSYILILKILSLVIKKELPLPPILKKHP